MVGPGNGTSAGVASGAEGTRRGILLMLVAMLCISINDMTIKRLSGDYPLHQMVFVRSAIGICFSFVILRAEGGIARLRTERAGLHFLRCLMIVIANLAFFASIAVIPLATATALFFAAPLFITLLSIPILGERVGPRRWTAVIVGFFGVVVMLQPWQTGTQPGMSLGIAALPVLAALCYAAMQILTRWLRATAQASVMAIYIQGTFLLTGGLFWLVAGDGRFADGLENPAALFLLRAWVWPVAADVPHFLLIGLMSACIGYSLSEAYRSAAAAVVAPFEYLLLPLALFWGWAIFGELPGPWVFVGGVLVAAAGLYVFIRERVQGVETMRLPRVRR
ncbi:MAG: DMT family transporter [Pikeienuella sp.]